MELTFKQANATDVKATNTESMLTKIAKRKLSGHLYVKPKHGSTLRCVGRFENGVGMHTNSSSTPPFCGWVDWVEFLHSEGHKLG